MISFMFQMFLFRKHVIETNDTVVRVRVAIQLMDHYSHQWVFDENVTFVDLGDIEQSVILFSSDYTVKQEISSSTLHLISLLSRDT